MTKPVIYRIRNVTDQKFYVGSTVNAKERFRTHRNKLRSGKHHTPHLQAAWNKHGEECFVFEVVEEICSVDLLQAAEDVWLEKYVGKPECYNAGFHSGAPWRGSPREKHPNYGRPKTDAERAAISGAIKRLYEEGFNPRGGVPHTDEAKAKISARVQAAIAEGRGGKFIPSEETRLRMSQALKGNQNAKGHTRTAEHRQKLSEANRGNKNWLGRHHTEESKAKMSKQVVETTTGTVFPSLSATLEHYGLKMPTLRRALVTGNPLSKGPHKGLAFRYVSVSPPA